MPARPPNRAVKSGGLRATAPRIVRGARRPDPSARWKGRLRSLRPRLATRDALVQAVREANATLDPAKVAEWLVRQGNSWIPASCWAVVARDSSDQLTVLADVGLNPELGPALWSAADWVMRHGSELLSADLARTREAAAAATAR